MWMAWWAIGICVALIVFVVGIIFRVVNFMGGLVDSFLARYWWVLLAIVIVVQVICGTGERIVGRMVERDANKKFVQNQGNTLERTGTSERKQ